MKTVRTAAKFLALLLVLTFVLLPFVGCGKKTEPQNVITTATQTGDGAGGNNTPAKLCTVVVATEPETVYQVDLNQVTVDNGLISVLEYLKENEGFTYETKDTGYGAFLTKVLTLDSASIENGFITLLTSVEKDFDVTSYAVEQTYNGTKIVTSGLGASSMTIEAGAVYYIALSSY